MEADSQPLYGFDPNLAKILRMIYVSQQHEVREDEFLHFRRGLIEYCVLIIKILTKVSVPLLQEAIMMFDLLGNPKLVYLTEISAMAPKKRK